MKKANKKKIKVPAYDNGTPGVSGTSAGSASSGASKLTGEQVGAIGQGVIATGGMLANSFLGTSTATTGSLVAAQTAGDIFGGIGKGASIGAAFGPWGAAIGGAIGGVVGSIGLKGREAGMTSFTDYDLGTLGTGLMGAFGANRRLRRERNRIKSNAYANRAAVEGTENLAYEFAQENTMGGVNSFKDGGMMGNKQLAFTDRGEVMLHPDGTVTQNPDAGTHGADQYLSALEPGTAVLGNKINPRTGNKFKEDGDAVTKKYKTRKSLQNIQFADSKMLNDRNMEAELQRLVDEQQAVLDKEGNKKKFKKLDGSKVMAAKDGVVIPAYDGGETETLYYYMDENGNLQTTTTPKKRTIGAPNKYTTVNPVENGLKWDYRLGWITDYGREARIARENKITEKTLNRVGRGNLTKLEYEQLAADQQLEYDELMNLFITDEKLHTISPEFRKKKVTDPDGDFEPEEEVIKYTKPEKDYSWIGDLAGTIGQLAAAIPGLGAKPEIEDAVYNPYHRTVMNSMRNRRAKLVEGAMADNARERAISNYNLTRTGANTGRNLAAMTQSAVNAADAIAKVRLQEDNTNNQYRGEEAEMLNDLGQQWVNATNLARTNNAQNRAAALMTNDTARKSIHNILAGSTKSYNTKLRDKQLLPLYRRFLEAGFTHEDLAPLYS